MSAPVSSSHFTLPFEHRAKEAHKPGLGALLKNTFDRWADGEAYRMAASQAYYFLLSLFPLLLVLVGVGQILLGDSQTVRGQLLSLLDATNSPTVRSAVVEVLDKAQQGRHSMVGLVIGFLGSVFSAGGIFVELDSSFNRLFGRDKRTCTFKETLRDFFVERFHGSLLVFGTILVLLSTVLLSTALTTITKIFPHQVLFLAKLVSLGASVALLTGALTLCYRYIPDDEVPWRSAALGAVAASVLFHLVRWPFSWLVVHTTDYAAYGVVGSILTLIFWFYLITCVLLFGVSLTASHLHAPPPLIPRPPPASPRPAAA